MAEDTYSLAQLQDLQKTFAQTVSLYVSLVSSTSGNQNLQKIDASTVENPLDELIKLIVLVRSHATKLGIVFKHPFKSSNYTAAYKQLSEYFNVFALLISLVSQINKETKFSILLKKCIISNLYRLFTVNQELATDYGKLLDDTAKSEEAKAEAEDTKVIDTKNKARLVVIGKIWNTCDEFTKELQEGELVLLDLQVKLSINMINDALEDFEEWLANPEDVDDDPFGLNDFTDDEDEITKNRASDDDEKDEEASEKELEKKINLGKVWITKVKLIKLLYSLISKSVITLKKSDAKITIQLLNFTFNNQFKVVALIDDFVSSLSINSPLEEIEATIAELIETVNKLNVSLKNLNALTKTGNKKFTELQASWTKKFSEDLQ